MKENMKKITAIFIILLLKTVSAYADDANPSLCENLTADTIWVDYDYSQSVSYTADGSLAAPYATIEAAFNASGDTTTLCIASSATAYTLTSSSISGWSIYGGYDVNIGRSAATYDPSTNETFLNLTTDVEATDAIINGLTITLYSESTQYRITMTGTSATITGNYFHTGSLGNIYFTCEITSGCDYIFSDNRLDIDNSAADDGRQGVQTNTNSVLGITSLPDGEHDLTLTIQDNVFTLLEDPVSINFIVLSLESGTNLSGNIELNDFIIAEDHSFLESILGTVLYIDNSDSISQTQLSYKNNHLVETGSYSSTATTTLLWLAELSGIANTGTNLILIDGNSVVSNTPSLRAVATFNDDLNATFTNNQFIHQACNGACVFSSVTDNDSGTIHFINNTFMYLENGDYYGYFSTFTRSSNIGIIDNNIFYNAESVRPALGIIASNLQSISSIQNNIFYSPNSISHSLSPLCNTSGYLSNTALNDCYATVQNNIISTDPEISRTTYPTDATQTDFSPISTSVAIDAGLIHASANIDINGISRYCGAGYDIGAYEYDNGTCVSGYDNDGDGLDSVTDTDDDGDGIVDWADDDDDNDGVLDLLDDFPWDASESDDLDGDGLGNNTDTDDDGDGTSDAQDSDDDNDGVIDTLDAFPLNPTESQDTDGDGEGDAKDLDYDGDGSLDDDSQDSDFDGYPDNVDAAPLDITEWSDGDADGVFDNADLDDDNDGVLDTEDTDDDNDGTLDSEDAFPSDPTQQSDNDGDRYGDSIDDDDDNDGYSDSVDEAPLDATEWIDGDNDGTFDNEDLDDDNDGIDDIDDIDDDNDGVIDLLDNFPSDPNESEDIDDDGLGNNADTDDDGDGIPDSTDDFPESALEWNDGDDDGVGDNEDTDDDNDGTLDADDSDDDNDGTPDTEDDLPSDPNETLDTDGDLIGNNEDDDDDGDGYPDSFDAAPLDATEWVDGDGDGILDTEDTDDDNDGILDTEDTDDDNDGVIDALDAFPSDPTESEDSDGDNIGDNAETTAASLTTGCGCDLTARSNQGATSQVLMSVLFGITVLAQRFRKSSAK